MITAAVALSAVPAGLRDPLIAEYQSIVQNFLENRWLPTELSGGRFSEIVYTILAGHAKKAFANAPAKPPDFVADCRKLEKNKFPHVPRSFQILIPRVLVALYEIRNNRNVGHVGGDVDSNHMDSVVVLSMTNWVMAELVRVFHNLPSTLEAQRVVDALAEVKIPLIWSDGNVKRVLRPELKLHQQILLLTAATVPDVSSAELVAWIEHDNKKYVMRTIRSLHAKRFVEFTEATDRVKILPPGAKFVMDFVKENNLTGIV